MSESDRVNYDFKQIAKKDMKTYYKENKDNGYDTKNVTGYAAYTELFDAFDAGRIDAVAINELMLNKYANGLTYAKHKAEIGSLEYAVATLSSNSAIATVADMVLADMGY